MTAAEFAPWGDCDLTPVEIARANRPTNCSFCGASEVRTLETRPNNKAIRRRKQCLSCKRRETTYEISQAEYRQLQTLEKLRAVLLGADIANGEAKLNCSGCMYWERRKCEMDFPEAGGLFANDCACYKQR